MASEPLLPIHLMPVWSAAHPRSIKYPDDVLHHPMLGPDHRPEFWQEWLRAVALDDQAARPRDIDALLLYERTLSGAGVAIGIEPLTSGLLDEGRLEALAAHRLRSVRSFFLVEPSETRTRAARLFRAWLRDEAQG
jgi:DNA-binding transcriptional LysR family regulator